MSAICVRVATPGQAVAKCEDVFHEGSPSANCASLIGLGEIQKQKVYNVLRTAAQVVEPYDSVQSFLVSLSQQSGYPSQTYSRHDRAKIGFVLSATEQTVQEDMLTLCPQGVGMHFTRAAIPDSITNATLTAQVDLLADCAATLLPDGSLDVVAYACTSGSLVIGEERVFVELNKGAPNAQATSLITAARIWYQHAQENPAGVVEPLQAELSQMRRAIEQRDAVAFGYIQRNYIAYGFGQLTDKKTDHDLS